MTDNLRRAKQALETKLREVTQSGGWRDTIAIERNADPLDTTQRAAGARKWRPGASIGMQRWFARFEPRSIGSMREGTACVSIARSRFHISGCGGTMGRAVHSVPATG